MENLIVIGILLVIVGAAVLYIYGRKRRKVQDVSDVRLPVTARRMDVKRRNRTVNAIR